MVPAELLGAVERNIPSFDWRLLAKDWQQSRSDPDAIL